MKGLEIGIGNWNHANFRPSLPLQQSRPGGTRALQSKIGIAARFAMGRAIGTPADLRQGDGGGNGRGPGQSFFWTANILP